MRFCGWANMPRIEPDGEAEGGYNWLCFQVFMANDCKSFRKIFLSWS